MSEAVAVPGDFECIGDLMDAAALKIGEREAYVDGDRSLTFSDWVRSADGVAALLHDRGVRRGDVVALHLSSSIDYAILYAAIARIGGVATGINPRLGPTEIEGIVSRCSPRLVVSEAAQDDRPWGGATLLRKSDLVEGAKCRAYEGNPGPSGSDPVAIIWTSGTTGSPKGAWFDHRNLEAAVRSAGAMTQAFDRRISAVPMVHAGYMSKLWEQLAMGVTIVLSPTPWSAESMLEVLVKQRITVGAGVPTQWSKLMELPGIETADLSNLRIGLVATAPAAPELVERVSTTLGCPLVVRYAMTECPSISGTDPTDPPELQYHSVGRPQDGMEIELVDEAGATVPRGEVGRVRVRGGCVMRGYWEDPDETAAVLSETGVLTTSDLGRWNEEGCLVLAGRVSDMYIRGGYNVYPIEVEHVLVEHPNLARAAVVGAPTDVIGELGVAFVAPAAHCSPPSLEEVRAWVGARLADYKRPDRVVIVDELPLTSMLKVDKVALRAQLGQ